MLSRIFSFLFVGFSGFFLVACDSDLNSAKSIDLDQNVQVETTKGAEIIYSDSAKVKAKLKAPILLHFKAAKPYYEMPKGINVVFYDENLNPTSTVTSDYALRREHEKRLSYVKMLWLQT